MSISDIILVIVASASVAAVVVGIFAILQAQIQAREALAESRSQALASQKMVQEMLAESRSQAVAAQKMVQEMQEEGRSQALATQKIAQETLAESRSQAQETLYALNRPILTPRAPLPLRDNNLDWDAQHHTIKIRNVGTGVALHVWGVLLAPKKQETSDIPSQYCLRAHVPIAQEDNHLDTFYIKGETKFRGDELIENRDGMAEHYCLCPPSVNPSSDGLEGKYVARLTLTYRDVFGRKHASIYDHTDRHRWTFVVHLDDIRNDLEDLN